MTTMTDLTDKVYKVAIAIPNEAFILPEAFDPDLIHAYRTGAWEERLSLENSLVRMREYVKAASTKKEYEAFVKGSPKIKNSLGEEKSIDEIEFHPARFEFYWFSTGRLLTQMAREKLLKVSLDQGMDFCIQFDNDMGIPGDMSIRLLDDMIRHPEIDVLGALAFMRNPPHYAVIYNVLEGYDTKEALPYYINHFYKNYPKDTLVECDAVGFGAACIRLSFVRKHMKEPYFMSTSATGEDILFCSNVKKAGGRVFMDTRIKLGHLKNPEFIDEEYAEKWWKDHQHDMTKTNEKKYDPVESGEIAHKLLTIAK